MSSVQNVITFIETNILIVLPSMKQSPNYYSITDNDSKKIDSSYSVRPLDASPINGTIKNATYEQAFEIEITRNYNDSSHTDLKLRQMIESIFIDHQAITKQLSLRRAQFILLVGVPSKGAPVVDRQNKFVSVTYTYPIQYRELIKEV